MICLIRHGETDWNFKGKLQGKTDIPLNETGKNQAVECKAFFTGSDWDLIISSPLSRAKQTAEIINEGLNLEIVEMPIFKERSFGVAEGLTIEEIKDKYPDGNYPGKETKESLKKRVMAGLEEINQKYPTKKVLLVAHGAVINSILNEISGGTLGTRKTKLMNACISHVQFLEEGWKIHNYNQVDHLTKYNEI